MRSGVESLRAVLADNPIESSNQRHSGSNGRSGSGSGSGVSPTEVATAEANEVSESRRSSQSQSYSQSGAWSFLPPSLTGKQPNNNRHSPPAESIKTAGSTIADSVAESIKNLGTGLGLGQLAGGLGLAGNSGSGPYPARGSTGKSTQSQQPSRGGPYLNSTGGSSSRSRIWAWNGQDKVEEPEMGSDSDSVRSRGRHSGSSNSRGHPTEMLRTGSKAEKAAKETAALLAKVRAQQDEAMERARRMPEVEKLTQRYQDSWREIHDHTTRNSEKADDADEILEKVLELCTRHVNASMQLAEETKGLGDLDKSMDEMVVMSENIHKKLVGLESKIAKLEEEAEVMSLADWKKSKTTELDKYMELKRKELWDKAELLSTRSEQFQKEESARKLRQYQNQFQTDMEKFRRIQQEREQDLWKVAEAEAEAETKTPGNISARIPSTNTHSDTSIICTTTASVYSMDGHKQPIESEQRTKLLSGISVYDDEEEDQLREQEDLDRFLGSATESDSQAGGDDGEENEEDDDDEEEPSDDESEELDDEDDGEEEEESSEDDLDPIAKARMARAAAATIAAAAAAETRPGALQGASAGSTISTFSALVRNPSAMSLPKS